MHLDQLVDVLHLRTRTLGHADLALGIEQFGALALLGRHRTDDRIHVEQDLVVHARLRHRCLGLLHARHHARQHAEAAHVLHLAQLGAQVVHVELTLGHPRRELFGVFLLDRRRRLFDDGDDVAHAEDATGHALGMEGLNRVELFARRGKLDRLAGNGPHRQRRTAARIAVHAGQHHAGQVDFARERLRHVDRVLAGQRIDHQQRFARGRDGGDRLHLVHQCLIDVETARRIEQQHVHRLQLGGIQRARGDLDRQLTRHDRQCAHARLLAQHLELLLCRRAVDVERRHQDLLALLFLEQLADLGGAGGLARALQADHHDHHRRRGVQVQLGSAAAQHLDQRVVDDLDDLLSRRDRAQHVLADRLFGHLVDEAADHRQRDVGFEQRDAHFAHGRANVFFLKRATTAQAIEDAAKPV